MNKIKNIQEYLRLNYPLLWNVKIFPALLVSLFLNLFFFGIAYLANRIDFQEPYSYGNLSELYFFSVVSAILSFVVWLIFYARNNAIKRFYPMKSSHLFMEWLFSFLIIGSFVAYPFSVSQGGKACERSYLTKEEVVHGAEVLNMVGMLIPESKYQYDKNHSYANAEGEHYSLLDYSSTDFYISSRYDVQIKGNEEVRELLVKEDVKHIKELMDKYFALEAKYNLRSNISTDQWFRLIYNPPAYTISRFDQIKKSKDSFEARNSQVYYVNYNNLKSAYSRILDAHYDVEASKGTFLVVLYFALGISMAVFSFRVTSGKSWLIALVVLGLIGLLWGFFAVLIGNSGAIVNFIFWIGLFLYLLFDLSMRIRDRRNKGKLSMFMNIFIWYLPAIMLLVYGFIMSIAYQYHEWDEPSLYRTLNDFYYTFMWINAALTIGIMWFASKFIRKWKSLPDE